MATIVVYGGGFQPFHVGHLSSYLQAKKAFPNAAFYVAASNDTKQRPIPFNDKQFLAQQAGVTDPMVETRNPINPVEILSQYNPNKDVYIIVRSERDPMPYTKKDGSPAYYQPYVPGEPMQPFGKHGYVFVTKKHTFMVGGHEIYSGTQVRDMYTNADDKGRLELIHELYPKSKQQRTIKKMLDKYLVAAPITTGSAMTKLKQKKLAEHIKKIRPLLKEANGEQKLKLMKLMKSALSENRIMDRDALINAYYVSRKGDRHKVAEGIPYYLLDKLVGLLTKKYNITMNDIEVRPVDKNQYRRTHQPELAEKKENNVSDAGYDEFIDPTAKRALDMAKQHYPGSKSRQEAFVKFVQRSLEHAEQDDRQQDQQIQRLEQELAQIRQVLSRPQPVGETSLNKNNPQSDLDAKRQALQQMELEPGHDKEAVRQRKLDLDSEARAHGLNEFAYGETQMVDSDLDESLKGKLAAAALGAAALGGAGDANAIAGAFPTPSHQAAMYKAAADSNAAQARADAAAKAQADAKRLKQNTAIVDRHNKINYHGANAPKPSNAEWDGDSDFLEIDGTKYAKASRMPIPGGEAPDMKLIVTKEGWQVYIWTRNSLKGVVGRYFYPAEVKESTDYLDE